MNSIENNSSNIPEEKPTIEQIYKKIENKYNEDNPESFIKIQKEYNEANQTISLWEYIWEHVAEEQRNAYYLKSLALKEEGWYQNLLNAKTTLENIPPFYLNKEGDIKELCEEIKSKLIILD